jgi:hypothetical protein
MNHEHIDAHDIRSRYVAGRLDEDEEREFEAHLVDCPDCIEGLECEAGLRDGLRTVSSEYDEQLRKVPGVFAGQPKSAPRWGGAARPRAAVWTVSSSPWLLQAAALLLVASTVGLGVWLSRSSVNLREARAERDQLQRRAAQAEASTATLQQQLADEQRRTKETPAVAPPASVVPAAVFALTTVRGSSTAEAAAVNRVRIGGNPGLVVLSLDVPGLGASDAYTVTLKDRSGRTVWTGGTFPPSSPDSLSVAIDPTLLQTGDYTLELGRRSGTGALTLISRYPFRVSR